MGLFSAKQASPPIISTDDITPLRFVDELYPFSFDFSLVFRDVMDVELLRAAADTVLQREGWRQLGARLRRTVCTYPFRHFQSAKSTDIDMACRKVVD